MKKILIMNIRKYIRFLAATWTNLRTPFRSKSYVCSVNPTNLALWFEALLAIWYHIFMCFLLLDLWYTIKTKVVVWKLGCEKIFHIKLYGQALTAKYKGLTVKVETKHLLKNWFPDYRFCFYQSNRSMVMRTT